MKSRQDITKHSDLQAEWAVYSGTGGRWEQLLSETKIWVKSTNGEFTNMVSDLSFRRITTMDNGKAWAAFESHSFLWDKAIPNFDRAPFFIYTQTSSFKLSEVAKAIKNVPPAFHLINNPRTWFQSLQISAAPPKEMPATAVPEHPCVCWKRRCFVGRAVLFCCPVRLCKTRQNRQTWIKHYHKDIQGCGFRKSRLNRVAAFSTDCLASVFGGISTFRGIRNRKINNIRVSMDDTPLLPICPVGELDPSTSPLYPQRSTLGSNALFYF